MRVLGGLEVEGVNLSRLGSRKARRLLGRLAIARGAAVATDGLADVVWGDEPPSQPADQLSVLVSRLRSAIGPGSVARTAAGYALAVDWLDVRALDELATEARRRLDAGAIAPAAAAARAALDLLRGPLLPEESAGTAWLDADRALVARCGGQARLVAAEAALAAGDPWSAATLAAVAIDAEPYDEAALRVLMAAHSLAGRPALALRAYADMATRLADDLGVDPAAATQSLHVRVLRGEKAAPIVGLAEPPTVPDIAMLPRGRELRPSSRLADAEPTDQGFLGSPAAYGLRGRSGDLARLRDALSLTGTGQPQVVLVGGEAGIGKTRLMSEFIAGLNTLGEPVVTVLTCRGDDVAGVLPMQPLIDAIAAHIRRLPDPAAAELLLGGPAWPVRQLLALEPAEPDRAAPTTVDIGAGTRRDSLATDTRSQELSTMDAQARDHSTGVSPAAPAFAGVFQPTDPAVDLSRLFAACDTVIARLAEVRPVVLCVDDVQWVDPTTRAWLRHAVARLSGIRLLILATMRSDEEVLLPAEFRLTLGPLDRPTVAAMLGLPDDSPRVTVLYARSGGNPMFLHELANADSDELPSTIRDAVTARCERAGPDVAATLRAAAVLGQDIDLELLAAVLDRPATQLLDHLEEGVRRRFLVESARGIHFTHQLVREALHVSVSKSRVALIHRQAARSLAARTRADPMAVAYHARLGGDLATTASALVRAAAMAASRFDFAEAIRLMDDAVAADDVPDIRIRRGRLRLRTSDTAGALADADAAREPLTSADPLYPAALEVAALVAYIERDFERARRLADEAGSLASDPELRASCLALAGRIRHAAGDLVGGRTMLERVAGETPASIAPVVDLWRGFLYVHHDEPRRTLRLVGGANARPSRAGYPFAPVNRHMLAGYARALSGEPAAALAEIERMSAAAARESTDRFTGRDDNFRGWILRGVGAFDEADDANVRALERSSALNLAEPIAHALLDLADGRLRAGDAEAAAIRLRALRDRPSETYLFQWRAQLRTVLLDGRCHLAAGDPTAAMAAFDEVLSAATRLSLRRYHVQARLWLAMARRRAGEAIDPASLKSDVDDIERVAPLEAWWLTKEVAAVFNVGQWSRLGDERADALARRSGAYRDILRRAATRY